MDYKPLAKLFHMDTGTTRFGDNERLAAERLNALGTYRTGIASPSGELFLASPHELLTRSESVLRVERRISLELHELPPVAQGALVRDLVVNEVVSTNEIENIHSTRRQISDALQASEEAHGSRDPLEKRRFRELANLYLGLSQKEIAPPANPEDIRAIYDKVMAQEPMDARDQPDGRLFRKGRVEVIGNGMRTLHEGVYPEQAIYDSLAKMIAIASSPDMPQLLSALVAHYVFEYVHPFYDGNGRTGRYLLALYLSEPLSTLTSLSLSRSIAENKAHYYASFREAEDPLNHGELTFFVMDMLETIQSAQTELVGRLDDSRMLLDRATHKLDLLSGEQELCEHEEALLYMLVQISLFATFPTASLAECADYLRLGTQQTRRYVSRLENRGLVTLAGKRPLKIGLSRTARDELGV